MRTEKGEIETTIQSDRGVGTKMETRRILDSSTLPCVSLHLSLFQAEFFLKVTRHLSWSIPKARPNVYFLYVASAPPVEYYY